jgi:hypothetical protein
MGAAPSVNLERSNLDPLMETAMRPAICALACIACSPFSLAADLPKPSGDAIVSPEARLDPVFTRSLPIKGGLTEGPAVAPDGSIFFSDIPVGSDKGKIMRFDPR